MTSLSFDQPQLFGPMHNMTADGLDDLHFGVIGFDNACIVRRYSTVESKRAGISAHTVLGMHMFEHVAQCMNNFMVAQRFHDALEFGTELDATIDYVLTFRMRPTRVKLRLLARPGIAMRYIAIQPTF